MARRDLTVVKLGGSHAFSAHLRDWVDAIAAQAGRVVVAPGGGPFADAVRDAQPRIGFDDAAAHRMALLAMEQYGCALASLSEALVPAESSAAISRAVRIKKVPVWLPTRMALAAKEIPWSWDVTSDSLAAWLSGRLGARRLVLVKHLDAPTGTRSAKDLVARGIVDPAFPDFLAASGATLLVLGPTDHTRLAEAVVPAKARGSAAQSRDP